MVINYLEVLKESIMKRLLLIVFPLLLIVGCSKPISEENLIEEDGLKYHPDTKELYTGEVFKNHIGGKLHLEGRYHRGNKKGIWTYWYKNGQKEYEGTYKDGVFDGLWTQWYKNGQKRTEETFKDGEHSYKQWNEDGSVRE